MVTRNDIKQDINNTSELILHQLKSFKERHGLHLEIEYKQQKLTTKLVSYFK